MDPVRKRHLRIRALSIIRFVCCAPINFITMVNLKPVEEYEISKTPYLQEKLSGFMMKGLH